MGVILCVVHKLTHRFDKWIFFNRAILRVLLTFFGKLPEL